MGNWTIENGSFMPTGSGEHRALLNGSDGTDYTINVKSVFVSGSNNGMRGYGIYYHATAGEDGKITGYCFQYDPGAGNAFTIRKVVNGKEQSAFMRATFKDAFGDSFKINGTHDIKIVVKGSNNTIYVDNVKVFEFTDSDFTSGSVGVCTWSDTVAKFVKITVKK